MFWLNVTDWTYSKPKMSNIFNFNTSPTENFNLRYERYFKNTNILSLYFVSFWNVLLWDIF